jgi:hypothetical protein
MAAVEVLRQPQQGGQGSYDLPAFSRERREFGMSALWSGPAMVSGDKRHDIDLVWLEAAKVAVLDQIVGVLVVGFVADMDADVVQQCGVFEPFALAVC